MSAATQGTVLSEFRTAVAAIATTRVPANLFVEASRDEDFRKPPLYTKERFRVEPGQFEIGTEFGRAGLRRIDLLVNVLLSHPPINPANTSVDYIAADQEKIADIIEARSWSTTGLEAVWFKEVQVGAGELADGDWVVSTVTFRVVYVGSAVLS